MRSYARLFAAAIFASASLAAVSSAKAQTQPNSQDQPSAQKPSPGSSERKPDLSDQKLDAAAAAIGRVASVKEQFEQRLESATPADRDRIVDEANSEIVKAVTDQGLSVEEYASILIVAQKDPQVRQKLLDRIKPPSSQ